MKTMSGEPMALKVINRINEKLKFIHQNLSLFIYNTWASANAIQCSHATTFLLFMARMVREIHTFAFP